MQHAHQKGVIHRDLKPSNILICLYDGKPVAKVIDFGLAKAMHYSLTEQTLHTALGTRHRDELSPEQVTCSANALVALFEKSPFARQRDATRKGLTALGPRLTPDDLASACDAMIAVLERSTEGYAVSLTQVQYSLAELAPLLSPEPVTRAVDSLIALLENSEYDSVREVAANTLAALLYLAPRLSPEPATRGWDALVTLLEKAADSNIVSMAGRGLKDLAPRINPGQVTHGGDAILMLLENSPFDQVRSAAAEGLAALVTRLSPEQVTRGLDAIDILLKKRLAPTKLLEALLTRLSAEQRVKAAESVESTLFSTSNGNLAESLAVIIPHLDPVSRDRFSTNALAILLDQEVSFRDNYQAQAYSYYYFSPANRAISNPKSLESSTLIRSC